MIADRTLLRMRFGLILLLVAFHGPWVAQATDGEAVPFIVSTRNDVVLFLGGGLVDYTEDVSIDPATSGIGVSPAG